MVILPELWVHSEYFFPLSFNYDMTFSSFFGYRISLQLCLKNIVIKNQITYSFVKHLGGGSISQKEHSFLWSP